MRAHVGCRDPSESPPRSSFRALVPFARPPSAAVVAMAVLVECRDNVVSIPKAESLKLFVNSLVWGSWMVVKNAVARAVSAVRLDTVGHGAVAVAKGHADSAVHSRRDYPPACLTSTFYGTHSYAKVKVRRLRRDVEAFDPRPY